MLIKISGPKKTSRRFSILHSELLFVPIMVQFRRLRCAGNEAGIGRQGMFFSVLARKILRKRRLGRSGSRWQGTLILISASEDRKGWELIYVNFQY